MRGCGKHNRLVSFRDFNGLAGICVAAVSAHGLGLASAVDQEVDRS